ncbi:MAG: DNA-processing protein DprA [Lysobacteraceae bacterium]
MPVGHAAARDWLILLRAPGLGGVRLRSLLERHGDARNAIAVGREGWRAAGLPAAAIEWLSRPDEALLETDLRWLQGESNHLLTIDSADFPPLLARMPQAPAALFVCGAPEQLWTAQIGIVGSRNPSAGGRENARDFANALAASGLSITSGLAEGIDAAAHRAALDRRAPTIAVMGTGPDRIYPASHRALAHDIVAGGGALVSEFPPGTGPRRENFPRRNRIIAGLSLGVLVVEAGVQSGALITARLAAEAGRDVFALPGSIHNPLARGCHRLIRDGAMLTESVPEILDAIAPVARELGTALRQRLAGEKAAAPAAAVARDPERERLWQALGHDPVAIDVLAERTGLTVESLSSMLLLMELEGTVAAQHGRYARLA